MSNHALAGRTTSHRIALAGGSLMLAAALLYAGALMQVQPPARSFAGLISQYEAALEIFPAGSMAADLAAIKLAAARSGQGSWQEAQQALEHTLAARPQDPLSWARLAYVYGEQGQPEKVAAPLTRSIETGSYLPGFMQWRFLIGLKYWRQLDESQKERVAGQAILIWRSKPNDFIRLARLAPLAAQIESIVSTYYPDELAGFLQRRGPLRHTRQR